MLFIGKLMLMFVAVLIAMIASCGVAWLWLSYENIPNLIAPTAGLSFDYIIVGAGTSGSVLAHELSRHSNKSILLIEAGHLFNPLSKVPLLATTLQGTKHDWSFKSVPQKFSSLGLTNHMQSLPRGKGLGGSAQINYMLHFTGNPKDFQQWSRMGIKGWSMRSHQNDGCAINSLKCTMRNRYPVDDGEHCYSSLCNEKMPTGKYHTIWTVPKNYSYISWAFVKASSLFATDKLRFRLSKYNIRDGVRWNAYERFLRPSFGRSNLKIISNALAKRVTFDKSEADGVIIQHEDGEFKISAREEVIISAGTFQTPQLLQVSGIGPKPLLDYIRVKQVHESKNVGSNLHDHFHLPLFVSINETASLTVKKVLNIREIAKYLAKREGHFSNFGVIGDITSDLDNTAVTIFATGAIDEKALMDISNFKREDFRSLFPLYKNSAQEGFVMLSSCMQPESRGTVKAQSSNTEDPPLIDPRYGQNQSDIQCIIQSVRNGVKVIMSRPFQRINAKIHWPHLKRCSKFGPLNRDFHLNEPSDEYLECLIRAVGLTGHHPGGTCSMGSSADSVLDNRLRVRGVNKLRVVDASVLPTPISGTPNSVIVAIAKRAAKLIIDEV